MQVGSGERSSFKVSSFDYDVIFSNTADPKMLKILQNSSLVPKDGADCSKPWSGQPQSIVTKTKIFGYPPFVNVDTHKNIFLHTRSVENIDLHVDVISFHRSSNTTK